MTPNPKTSTEILTEYFVTLEVIGIPETALMTYHMPFQIKGVELFESTLLLYCTIVSRRRLLLFNEFQLLMSYCRPLLILMYSETFFCKEDNFSHVKGQFALGVNVNNARWHATLLD